MGSDSLLEYNRLMKSLLRRMVELLESVPPSDEEMGRPPEEDGGDNGDDDYDEIIAEPEPKELQPSPNEPVTISNNREDFSNSFDNFLAKRKDKGKP